MSKINKLNSGSILQAYSKEFTQKKVTLIVGGKNYEVLVDEKFKISKLKNMILEAVGNMKDLEKYDDSIKITYYTFLMVKYFTDVDIVKTDDLVEQLKVLTAMIDLEIFAPIVDSFNPAEIEKASKFIKDFADKVTELANENKTEQEVKEVVEAEFEKLGEWDATV